MATVSNEIEPVFVPVPTRPDEEVHTVAEAQASQNERMLRTGRVEEDELNGDQKRRKVMHSGRRGAVITVSSLKPSFLSVIPHLLEVIMTRARVRKLAGLALVCPPH